MKHPVLYVRDENDMVPLNGKAERRWRYQKKGKQQGSMEKPLDGEIDETIESEIKEGCVR